MIIWCFINANLDFEKNHSTSHAIINLVERVSKALDTGKYVVGVFFYLKKAFDTVDHKILLAKSKQYGIRGNTHRWFESYLSNRKQYVEYNNYKSDTKTITHGVPQGSILCPLLFIIYMNDIENISKILNTELEKVNMWLKANKLTINTKKNSLYDVSSNTNKT